MSRSEPVKGLADLDKYLSALPANLQKNAIRQGLTAAARPVRDEARARSPINPKLIKTGSPRQNEDGTFSITVRLTGPGSFLGYFFEYGIDPHPITLKGNRSGKAGRNAAARAASGQHVAKAFKIGDRYVSGTISHPGITAQPFLLPALDLKMDEAIQAYADRIRAFPENKTGFVAPVDGDV